MLTDLGRAYVNRFAYAPSLVSTHVTPMMHIVIVMLYV